METTKEKQIEINQQNTIDMINELIEDVKKINFRIQVINEQCKIYVHGSLSLHNVPKFMFTEKAKFNVGEDNRRWLSENIGEDNGAYSLGNLYSENL